MHSDFTEDLEKFKQKLLVNSESLFLFGYGSTLWKVEFDYKRKLFGHVDGYRREFWLLSDDHRGTPEKMGRVVTLVKSKPKDRVYGVAYEIERDKIQSTFDYLNEREKCGYSLNEVLFYPVNEAENAGRPITCLCYFANEENSYYSPSSDLNAIAQQIFVSRGPSGANKDYFYNLCKTLRQLAQQHSEFQPGSDILSYDQHLFELEHSIGKLDNQTE